MKQLIGDRVREVLENGQERIALAHTECPSCGADADLEDWDGVSIDVYLCPECGARFKR